ncbi:MAG TPA: alpha/beta hydrolase [Pirellulales bacterium]
MAPGCGVRIRGVRAGVALALGAWLAVGLCVATAEEGEKAGALPTRTLPRENLLLCHDAQGEVQPVKSAADWDQRKRETLAAVAAVLGAWPGDEKRVALEMQVEEELDAGTYLQRRITYRSEPDCRVPAYLLIPKAALVPKARPFPAVLALHPTHHLGPESITKDGPNADRRYAHELAERGYVVLAPAYPLLGEYQPDLKKLGWESGLLKAVWDNVRGLDLLDSLPFVKTKRYVAIGHSLGGHNAVFTGVFDDRLHGVISSCGLDSFVDYYQGNPDVWQPERGWTQTRYMPKLAGYRGRLNEIPFDFHELIASLAPRSVLIVAPLEDDNFLAESVDRVAAAARPVFALYDSSEKLHVEHPPGGHNFPPAMREKSYLLIDSLLRD